MNNRDRIESLLEGLNQVSQNVNRFKNNLKWDFKYVEDKYYITEEDIGIKLAIVYKDITVDLNKILIAHKYECTKNSEENLEVLRGILYNELIQHMIFLVPQKFTSNLGDVYITPVRDLIRGGWEKCIQNIDENELRSNSENKE